MEITDEQMKRAEKNRLAALEKRKRAASAACPPISGGGGGGAQEARDSPWRLFKCKKIIHDQQKKTNEHHPPPPPRPPPPPTKFSVVLEICSPSEFSIFPEPVQDFSFPGKDKCFRRIEDCLQSTLSFRSMESQVGRKMVYGLQDYESVSSCIKKMDGVQLVDIPYKTRIVVEIFSVISGHRWIPCMPHHLPDVEVEQLIEKLPATLRERLLPFQLEGVRFGLRRGGRCLIADEMGLGKTLQAIAIASCFVNEDPILVVCPAVLRYSWAEELERWFPFCLPTDIHLVFGHQNSLDRIERIPRVVVISYNMLHRLRKSMFERRWAVMIVDESHNIRCTKKKTESGETETVLHMATLVKHIILLSGTPSLSRPYDIFNQVNILWFKLLGDDKYEFAKNYCFAQVVKGANGKIYKDFSKGIRLEELNVLLSQTLMIRRLKAHVLSQLPPKRRQIIRVKLWESDILHAMSAKSRMDCAKGESIGPANHRSLNEKSVGNDLSVGTFSDQNVCVKTSKDLSNEELGIAKLHEFREWLYNHSITADIDDSLDMGQPSQKMIIFGHHIKVLDGIQELICEKLIKFVRIDGSTSSRDRQTAVEAFRTSSEVKIVLIGITAGGVGLDFSSAQNVVFVELPKSASEMLQAEDRAHRRGQTNSVNIYIFCAKDTSDESHWLQLNKSLYRVSSMMNGKVDAIKEIEVDGVCEVGNARDSLHCTTLDAIATDKQISQVSGCLVVNGKREAEEHASFQDKINNFPSLGIGEHSSSLGELECSDSEELENGASDCVSSSNLNDASQSERHGKICFAVDDAIQNGAYLPTEGEQNNSVHPESIRFEVSQHTGRIHLYICNAITDSRPKPVFENFRPEDLESLTVCFKNRNKEVSLRSMKENPSYRDIFQKFVKEWSDLRSIDQNKLLGKPLQLPLNLELCYLKESINHGREGLPKGRSKRRVTPLNDVNSKLPTDCVWKKIILHNKGSAKENNYTQAWTTMGEPLCKLCQKTCNRNLARKPEYFEDLFCNLRCYEEYRIRTNQGFLREALFQIEHGVCSQCKLDCHKLVRCIKPLPVGKRQDYVKRVAPQLAENDKMLKKLVSDPNEGNAWHADHIVPVYKGGGECRLENMRTLCVACHSKVTALQTTERCQIRMKAKKQLKLAMAGLKKKNTIKNCESNNTIGNPQAQGERTIEEDLFIQVPGSSYYQKEE